MTAARARQVLLANAAFDAAVGLLLLAGTWDGLWDALDLPRASPALFAQIGGAALWGLAYLQWRAADQPPLRGTVATAAAGADALGALVILTWFATGELPEDVDALGTVLLVAAVVVLVVFLALKLQIARERPGPEEFRRSE
jgi:hypothetical protein